MKQYIVNNQIVTASSKEEAVKVVSGRNKDYSVKDYYDAILKNCPFKTTKKNKNILKVKLDWNTNVEVFCYIEDGTTDIGIFFSEVFDTSSDKTYTLEKKYTANPTICSYRIQQVLKDMSKFLELKSKIENYDNR